MDGILLTTGLQVGTVIDVMAYCSLVEVSSNLRAQGSYREEYHLHGIEGSYLKGIIFKYDGMEPVDREAFKHAPVRVVGSIGEYLNQLQLNIKSITSLKGKVDTMDLLAHMKDFRLVNELTDIVHNAGGNTFFSSASYSTALGLKDPSMGALVSRLYKFLSISEKHYPDQFQQLIPNLSLIVNYLENTECTLQDKLDIATRTRDTFILELLFQQGEFPEHVECAKMFALILDPKG